MSKYGILATLLHYLANTVLLKNLPRWRADNIRPYTVCAIKLPLQKFATLTGGYYPPLRRRCHRITATKICCTNEF